MKVIIVSKKLIKPYTPTPSNLNIYTLSFLDELTPPMNIRLLLSYPSKPKEIILEESLSKTLSQFYPLSGRLIKKDHVVDCSDQGVDFIQAEASEIDLVDFVQAMNVDRMNDLLPQPSYIIDESPLLSIQITELKCGGVVIGVSVSHVICDAASLGSFISSWSNASRALGEKFVAISPVFESSSLFPGKNLDFGSPDPDQIGGVEIRLKQLLFTKEAIHRLKLRLKVNEGVISSEKVVCGFITKVLIGLDTAKNRGATRRCLIVQPLDIRGSTIPPLDKGSFGNLAIPSLTRCMSGTEAKEMGFEDLVYVLGDAIDKTVDEFGEILALGEEGRQNMIIQRVANAMENTMSGDVNAIWFADWSKFGFWEADFGWGKPDWAGIGPLPAENLTVLTESKEGDGIEAWVHLNPNDMASFEQDEDVRSFTI